MTDYQQRTSRNWGYIEDVTQKKIQEQRLVIAGCGMGSVLAEVAARIGFCNFVLIDGDEVEIHNLNRQAFLNADIGERKVVALKNKLHAINPNINVEVHDEFLTSENVKTMVQTGDIVLDTIDFLDLEAVTTLHDYCFQNKITIMSAMNAGFGSMAIFIPPMEADTTPFRKIFGVTEGMNLKEASYSELYIQLFQRLAPALDPKVVEIMQKVFQKMADGQPCPAPQVAPGSYATGSLVVTALCRHLAGDPVMQAPAMIGVNLNDLCQVEILRLL
tara:strand:+ start:3758 stop:4579 length:822 start_codon:yes stop_codon:yes gene_type:complete